MISCVWRRQHRGERCVDGVSGWVESSELADLDVVRTPKSRNDTAASSTPPRHSATDGVATPAQMHRARLDHGAGRVLLPHDDVDEARLGK